MRREGFELTLSRPKVVYKELDGTKCEPYEEVTIDVDEEFSSIVIDNMNQRKAEMLDMRQSGTDKTRLLFIAPSRGLIGYQSKFLTDTRGTGVLNRVFHSYKPFKGEITERRAGALISTGDGKAIAYAIWKLQDRGIMFVKHHVRASGSDEAVNLTSPKIMSLEEMMTYINSDELLEVTPQNLRLRKRYLDPNERKKYSKVGNI